MNLRDCLLAAVVISAALMLNACAAGYRPINVTQMGYTKGPIVNNVEFQYKYNVLYESGNKKYANRETKRDLRLIAVKIINNGSEPITFLEDVTIKADERVVLPVEPAITHSHLKQIAPLYLLYSLLWLNITNCDNGDCNTIPLPLGLVIGVGNVAVASSANNKMMAQLLEYDILNKTIEPGQTAYGLMGIKDTGYAPLKFELK